MLSSRPIIIEFSGDKISTTIDMIMLILTLISVCCAFVAYRHQRDRSKKAAACELARYYADSVIDKYSFIASVFSTSKLDNYIKDTISLNEIKFFDQDELKGLLKEKNIDFEQFMKKIDDIDPSAIIVARIANKCSTQDRMSALQGYYIDIDESSGNTKLANANLLRYDFSQEIAGFLNQLEWFAMNCRYGLADEELMYQSLHQTFLSTVWVLYPHISRNNVSNEDKFYTNVIWLFEKWHTRLAGIKQEAEEKKKKLQRKADAVKPKIFSGHSL